MARDYSRFTVNISRKYTAKERRAIASDIINHIRDRSARGVDRFDNEFKSGYTKEYEKSIPGKASGKKEGDKPNLRLTGEMLESLEVIQSNKGKLVIGYKKTGNKDLIGKAEGNIRGTYGQSKPIKDKARDFMGVSKDAMKQILKDYPLTNDEKREKNTESTIQSNDFTGV